MYPPTKSQIISALIAFEPEASNCSDDLGLGKTSPWDYLQARSRRSVSGRFVHTATIGLDKRFDSNDIYERFLAA